MKPYAKAAGVITGLLSGLLWPAAADAQRFFPDDPLTAELAPVPTVTPQPRELSAVLELVGAVFGNAGERHPDFGVIPAAGVNTLGEVLDGSWYVNRHGRTRMNHAALRRGAGDAWAPSRNEAWRVLTVKPYGVRPGILIADANDQLYVLRFDPPGHLEMATGAAMVSSRFFHALGYHVPETYLAYFDRDQLEVAEGGLDVTSFGGLRDLIEDDVDSFLSRVAHDPERGYRAVASRIESSWDTVLGPYQLFDVRSDDPNDIVPHEHRRDLRGLFVFAAWLNYSNFEATDTEEVLVTDNGVPFIRRYLADFFATLGSLGHRPKSAREGNDPIYGMQSLRNALGLGFHLPGWMRARYPRFPSIGRFEYERFDPELWATNYDLAPFANRLPDDEFWAARQVMRFTDDDIRAIVSTGRYSDPEAEAWLVQCLAERRDRIGRTYFAKVSPIDEIRIEDDRLRFEDLAVNYGFSTPREYRARWSAFDNIRQTEREILFQGEGLAPIPASVTAAAEGDYFAARIMADDGDAEVVAYFRREGSGLTLAGIDRQWPGKVLADPVGEPDVGRSRYLGLSERQRLRFDAYTVEYNALTDNSLSPQEHFDSLPLSQRTTFDAVSHALINTTLTDENGAPLGSAIDLVTRTKRIAGQYFGRPGDQQFRMYVDVRPDTIETLERSREFYEDELNTVYHVGYPVNFRQGSGYPSIQISVSESGTSADIDVDYRSSKMPAALFNGHLTSANSDVRVGNNAVRHNGRWSGFVAWWRARFGQVDDTPRDAGRDIVAMNVEVPTLVPPDRPRGAVVTAVYDATQEFLTDWLVRADLDAATQFLSDQIVACVDTDDDPEDEVLSPRQAHDLLRQSMNATVDALGRSNGLGAAVEAMPPWDRPDAVVAHPYQDAFTILALSAEEAAPYLCDVPSPPGPRDEYHAALFRLRVEGDQGGAIGLLWQQEGASWRIVAYEVFEQ